MTYYSSMSSELEKIAESGTAEKYLPWYGAAGLGAAGSELVGRTAPRNYKLPARVVGAMLGTAAGVHGGEALGRKLDKTASEEEPSYFQRVGKHAEAAPWNKPGLKNWAREDMVMSALKAEKDPKRKTYLQTELKRIENDGLAEYGLGPLVHKQAQAEEPPPPHPAKTLAKSVLGLGAGMTVGYLGARGLNHAMRGRLPVAVQAAMPAILGAGGLAYNHMRDKTLRQMSDDHYERKRRKYERQVPQPGS